MNIHDTPRLPMPDDLIELGVASTETRGGPLAGEEIGGLNVPGISEE
ncbi:benenodin family lasso peptide [Xanthomonas sp. Kuri4-1]